MTWLLSEQHILHWLPDYSRAVSERLGNIAHIPSTNKQKIRSGEFNAAMQTTSTLWLWGSVSFLFTHFVKLMLERGDAEVIWHHRGHRKQIKSASKMQFYLRWLLWYDTYYVLSMTHTRSSVNRGSFPLSFWISKPEKSFCINNWLIWYLLIHIFWSIISLELCFAPSGNCSTFMGWCKGGGVGEMALVGREKETSQADSPTSDEHCML